MSKPRAIVSLYDFTTETVKPWADAGYTCFCVDIQHPRGYNRDPDNRNIIRVGMDVMDLYLPRCYDYEFGFAFPPCTDLAVSGARHFKNKLAANPEYRVEAMSLVYAARDLFEGMGIPYIIENPVSVISSEWRKPDHTFHPFEYGGYIAPEDAEHPIWPAYVAARDAYPKRTCLWTGGGYRMPFQLPVEVRAGCSDQFLKLGGKSLKTKNIRSATPRGFAIAVFEEHGTIG